MPKLSYDNVTMLDNMTRQCYTVMSPRGPALCLVKNLTGLIKSLTSLVKKFDWPGLVKKFTGLAPHLFVVWSRKITPDSVIMTHPVEVAKMAQIRPQG